MIQNIKNLPSLSDIKLIGVTDAWSSHANKALVSQGIIDSDTIVTNDRSVDFRSTQPLLRQEASVFLDKAFDYYTLPIK